MSYKTIKISGLRFSTMLKSDLLRIILIAALNAIYPLSVWPCSMYKITVHGKTLVGNNEDSWRQTSRIWFEPGENATYGAVYVGYADKQDPDGGMNEFGLVFDAFTMLRKPGIARKDPQKKDFTYRLLRTIMQQCKTVDDVFLFLKQYNLHVLNGSPLFNGGMLLFIDKTGKYLVVEADKMTPGQEDKFVLANFSLAGTKDLSQVKIERYRRGVAFLKNNPLDTSLAFCTALSDTMSVHRAKAGDGTLYTSIYDLNAGLIHTYFFHDYSKCITFNLQYELAKGNHGYSFPLLFPDNVNYTKFLSYHTPQNNQVIFYFLMSCGLFFFISCGLLLFSYFKTKPAKYNCVKPGVAVLNIVLGIYTFVLLKNQAIFYFPSPYYDPDSRLVSWTSYLPVVLLLCIIPLIVGTQKILQQNGCTTLLKGLLITNHLVYLILLGWFNYWKLFSVFHE